MNEIIPILSLITAILAVILGPFISWKIAKRQISSSFKVANKQIVAPMRQTWINNLRDLIAEIASISLHYYQAGFEDRKDSEYKRLTLLEGKISLMLNFQEDDHKELHNLIRAMLNLLEKGNDGDSTFFQIHPKIMSLSRHILKKEWNRVKDEIPSL